MRPAATSGNAEILRIRVALPKERPDLEDLQRRASLALPDVRDSLLASPDSIALPEEQVESGQVIVAEIDGKVAGFAAICGGELDGFFVEPDHWRRGIGSALVKAAAHIARRRGLSLAVTANTAARSFYESCGFSAEDEVETRFGRALRMSR